MVLSRDRHKFIIAGIGSGCGKTTVALGLMGALIKRGFSVAPFKCGPDYIDPLFHRLVTGRPSYNLDTFLMGRAGVQQAFQVGSANADVVLVEGVMGLFDGTLPGSLEGSSAELAELLELPVVLVVGCRGISGSIAPLVKGFCEWNRKVRIIGVIANQVGSHRHGELLAESLRLAKLPPLLGALIRDEEIVIPERHLGLDTGGDFATKVARISEKVDSEINLELLLKLTQGSGSTPVDPPLVKPLPRVRLGVARDVAFQFYYQDNFEMLQERGVELVFFSPLADASLPPGLSGLYFGGGFPELYAEKLASNKTMLDSVREFASSDRPVWGECGGMLYLLEELTDFEGINHRFTGLLPGRGRMNRRLSALGYRELKTLVPSFWGVAGTSLRGHEFHYSSAELEASVEPWFSAQNRHGEQVPSAMGGILGKVAGSYCHLHFASNPKVLEAFVEALR